MYLLLPYGPAVSVIATACLRLRSAAPKFSEAMMPHHRRTDQVCILLPAMPAATPFFRTEQSGNPGGSSLECREEKGSALFMMLPLSTIASGVKRLIKLARPSPRYLRLATSLPSGPTHRLRQPVRRYVSQSPPRDADNLGALCLEPCGHCGTRSQRLPASPKTTGADGTRRVEHLMANFGMCAFHATIEPPI